MSRESPQRPGRTRAGVSSVSTSRPSRTETWKSGGHADRAASRQRHLVEALEPRILLSGNITGWVFQDYNANGSRDVSSTLANTSGSGTTPLAADRGAAGITVTAFDAANVKRGTATTASDGSYTLGAGGTGPYRVQFTNLTAGFYPGPQGPDSHATVQFVPDGNSANVSLGLVQPSQYSPDNPLIVTSCYVYGDQISGGNATDPVVVAFPYDSGSNSATSAASYTSPTTHPLMVLANQVGATWGVAYSQSTSTLYSAAFMKRHSGFGPDGTGAIYAINAQTGAVQLFADLNAIFGANTAGANPHDSTNYETDNGNTSWNAVGKISLGGIAVSTDGQSVFAMNLADRSLYILPTSGPLTSVTVHRVQIPLSAPGATGIGGADLRPFAVQYNNGKVYVGVVNSAESTQNAADLHAYVYAFDPVTSTYGASPVFQTALNYPRGQADPGRSALWSPWSPTFKTEVPGTGSRNLIDPQPELTGLAFDVNGTWCSASATGPAARGATVCSTTPPSPRASSTRSPRATRSGRSSTPPEISPAAGRWRTMAGGRWDRGPVPRAPGRGLRESGTPHRTAARSPAVPGFTTARTCRPRARKHLRATRTITSPSAAYSCYPASPRSSRRRSTRRRFSAITLGQGTNGVAYNFGEFQTPNSRLADLAFHLGRTVARDTQ